MPKTSLLAAAALLATAAVASDKVEVRDLQNHPFAVQFPSDGRLKLQLRSGDFHIVGRDDHRIAIRLSGRSASGARDLTVRLARSPNSADLAVTGGPKNDLRVTIEVPKSTNLFIRMPAGNLEVEDISGDKDIELHAGDLSISVGNPQDYSHVDASVVSGGLEADPFGESHGGLFRSFEKNGSGRYRLHAHVGAGDLTLR